jgi:hypothetical protein
MNKTVMSVDYRARSVPVGEKLSVRGASAPRRKWTDSVWNWPNNSTQHAESRIFHQYRKHKCELLRGKKMESHLKHK